MREGGGSGEKEKQVSLMETIQARRGGGKGVKQKRGGGRRDGKGGGGCAGNSERETREEGEEGKFSGLLFSLLPAPTKSGCCSLRWFSGEERKGGRPLFGIKGK